MYGVANALYWKSSERQNSHTWQFWNIKIPKPPYISSLKIIGFLHFLNFLGPSEKNYNPQSLMITLYINHQFCRRFWTLQGLFCKNQDLISTGEGEYFDQLVLVRVKSLLNYAPSNLNKKYIFNRVCKVFLE